MRNMAGVPPERSNPIVIDELTEAGIPYFETVFRKRGPPEVQSTMVGVLSFRDGTKICFVRDWYYWMVRGSSPLPFPIADELNRRPVENPEYRPGTTMGVIVRVDGFAGGTDVDEPGCDNWHVDNQIGLNELVKTLKQHFGELSDELPSIEELAGRHLCNDAFYG